MDSPPREIELKLEASADDLRRLQRHPVVETLSQGPARSESLDSVYYDTASHDLARAGFGLRVRRSGGERVMTLKGEGASAGGLFERLEVEVPVAGEVPDLALIPDAALRERVEALLGSQPLVPVFRTEFRRVRRVLRRAGSEWSLDVDRGTIVAGDRRAPLQELELELRQGDPARLFEFALLLQEHFDVVPATRSKAERGYALARGEGASVRASRRVRLAAEASLEDALATILGQCLGQMSANADCAREGVDPEGVHQTRVGVRRLRVALAAFAPLLPPEPTRVLRSELRWLGRELGPARDLDVFLGEMLVPLEGRLGDTLAFKRLGEGAKELRAECYGIVRETLCSPRYAKLVLELGAWIADRGWRNQPLSEDSARLFFPARDFVGPLLDRRFKKLRRSSARIAESAEARHSLRIELKKLRYLGEFFRDLYPHEQAKRTLRRVSRLQRSLGRLNDVATAERILEALLARLGDERAPEHDRVAGFIEGFVAHLAEEEIARSLRAWKKLEHGKPFWR